MTAWVCIEIGSPPSHFDPLDTVGQHLVVCVGAGSAVPGQCAGHDLPERLW